MCGVWARAHAGLVNSRCVAGPSFKYLEIVRYDILDAAAARGSHLHTFDVGCNKGYDTALMFEMLAPGEWQRGKGCAAAASLARVL
jgi:hypothetical protein